MRIRTYTLALGVGLLAARVGEAAEPVSLRWNAPAGCPSRDAVLADVQRTLGGATGRHVAARADVSEIGPQHWAVHLTTDVDGAQGERTLDADSCASLATAAALILAWTVDPSKALAAASPSAAAAAAPSAAPEPQPGLPASPAGPVAPGPPLAVIVAASGAGDVGTLPSAGASGEVAVGALYGALRAEIAGAAWSAQHVYTEIRPGALEGADIQLLDARVRGCFRARLGERLEVDPCLGGAILFATSQGIGDATTFRARHESGSWGDLEADALAAWRLFGPVALRASLGIRLPLAPPRFVIERQQPAGEVFLHQPAPWGGRATLGVEARFP